MADPQETQKHLRKLKLQVQQRDNEINILVSMLMKKEGKGGADQAPPAVPPPVGDGPPSVGGVRGAEGEPGAEAASRGEVGGGKAGEAITAAEPGAEDVLNNLNLLADRNEAFELFRKGYRKNE